MLIPEKRICKPVAKKLKLDNDDEEVKETSELLSVVSIYMSI